MRKSCGMLLSFFGVFVFSMVALAMSMTEEWKLGELVPEKVLLVFYGGLVMFGTGLYMLEDQNSDKEKA